LRAAQEALDARYHIAPTILWIVWIGIALDRRAARIQEDPGHVTGILARTAGDLSIAAKKPHPKREFAD
jgi:hypothetical protein